MELRIRRTETGAIRATSGRGPPRATCARVTGRDELPPPVPSGWGESYVAKRVRSHAGASIHAFEDTMTDRVSTLLGGRRERLERLLGREVSAPRTGPRAPLPPKVRAFLREEAEDLYWNELEWEHITDEEALEEGPLTELAFPGFLAFIRGLLLTEVMPDAKAPASPQPEVVEDILEFLAARVVELEGGPAEADAEGATRGRTELDMTSRLIDLVLYRFHGLGPEDVERIEGRRPATS